MFAHSLGSADLGTRPTGFLVRGMVLLLSLLPISCGLEWLEPQKVEPEIVPPPESTYSSGTGTLLHEVGETQEVRLARVTPEFFEVLGKPWLGRTIIARDCEEGAFPVVVISHALWTEDFGGRREVIGRSVALDGREHEIIGVMPEAIVWPPGVQLWVPRIQVDQAFEASLGSGAGPLPVQGARTC